MRGPGIDQVAVDLVGHDHEVACDGQPADRLQLTALEHAAGRVVRVADHQDARVLVDATGQRPLVADEPGAAVRQWCGIAPPAHVLDRREERRVGGGLHDHALAHLAESEQAGGHRLDQVGDREDALGVRAPAEARLHALRESLLDA